MQKSRANDGLNIKGNAYRFVNFEKDRLDQMDRHARGL
jgi:hypothetical protein